MANILSSLTLRLYFARIAIICSICLVTANIEWLLYFRPLPAVVQILLYILVLLHHTITMTPLRFFYGVIDLLLLTLEIAGMTFSGFSVFPLQSFFPETFVFHAVLIWGTFGSLVGLLILRLATIARSRGRSLITSFDIYEDQPLSTRKTSFVNLLMGRSIWKVHFIGEEKPLRVSRGFLGLVFLCTLLFWILTKILFEPMKETALGPIKEYRTTLPPSDLLRHTEPPVWNILFPVPVDSLGQAAIPVDRFFESVSVESLWNSRATRLNANHTPPECYTKADDIVDGTYVYGFLCPDIPSDLGWTLPDLLISINFTKLDPGLPVQHPTSRQKVIHVVIGLTNSTKTNILEKTVALPLFQGINIVASIVLDLRQVYSRPALAAFGVFQATTTFWQSRIVTTYPDPTVKFHQDNSTLRLFWQDNWAETYVVQDYRQSSVIAGFASVGGLWTTLSGIFAILFGASMLQILYGQKPLSIFGLAHSFSHQRMKKETLDLYPNLIEEQKGPHGLLSLIRDHMIGLSFIDGDEEGPIQGFPTKTDEEYQAPSDKETQLPILDTKNSDFTPVIRPLPTPSRPFST